MKTLNENVLGLFPDKGSIETCVAKLRNLDFNASNITVEVAHPERLDRPTFYLGKRKKTKAPESALTTSIIGAGVGATLGALLFDSLAMNVYSAITIGIFMGALLGALVGWFVGGMVQEDDESVPARGLRADEVLLTVHVEDEEHARLAEDILRSAGARIEVIPSDELKKTTIPTHF